MTVQARRRIEALQGATAEEIRAHVRARLLAALGTGGAGPRAAE